MCVDVLNIDQTELHLQTHWSLIREQLLSGTYHPSAVSRVTIPNPMVASASWIPPTGTDRVIQQELLQVLQLIVDFNFCKISLTVALWDQLGVLGSHDLNSGNRKMQTRMTALSAGAQQMAALRRTNVVSQ